MYSNPAEAVIIGIISGLHSRQIKSPQTYPENDARVLQAEMLLENARTSKDVTGMPTLVQKQLIHNLTRRSEKIWSEQKCNVRLKKSQFSTFAKRYFLRVVRSNGLKVLPANADVLISDAIATALLLSEKELSATALTACAAKVSIYDVANLMDDFPKDVVSWAIGRPFPRKCAEQAVANRVIDESWLRANLLPQDGNIVGKIAGTSCLTHHSLSKPFGTAPELLNQFRTIKEFVLSSLEDLEPNIAAKIAHNSFKSKITPSLPYGRAPRLLEQYRSDREWLSSQLTERERNVAGSIASMSFTSPRSKSLPHGKAESILSRYRTLQQWLDDNLPPSERRLGEMIVQRSLSSPFTESRPYGSAPALLNQYESDLRWIRSNISSDSIDLAKTVARRSFRSAHTKSRPFGSAPELIKKLNASLDWVKSQVGGDELGLVMLIARSSFASAHSVKRPLGNAPVLLSNYRGDLAEARRLLPAEYDVAKQIASASFQSAHTENFPFGITPRLVKQFCEDIQWFEVQLATYSLSGAVTLAAKTFLYSGDEITRSKKRQQFFDSYLSAIKIAKSYVNSEESGIVSWLAKCSLAARNGGSKRIVDEIAKFRTIQAETKNVLPPVSRRLVKEISAAILIRHQHSDIKSTIIAVYADFTESYRIALERVGKADANRIAYRILRSGRNNGQLSAKANSFIQKIEAARKTALEHGATLAVAKKIARSRLPAIRQKDNYNEQIIERINGFRVTLATVEKLLGPKNKRIAKTLTSFILGTKTPVEGRHELAFRLVENYKADRRYASFLTQSEQYKLSRKISEVSYRRGGQSVEDREAVVSQLFTQYKADRAWVREQLRHDEIEVSHAIAFQLLSSRREDGNPFEACDVLLNRFRDDFRWIHDRAHPHVEAKNG